MKTTLLLVALCLASPVLRAQQAAEPASGAPWTLRQCIDHAQKQSLDVQRQAVKVEQSDLDLSTSRLSRLPDLSASVGYNASFGRSTSEDNVTKSGNQQTGSLNISAGLPLFEGLRINKQIKGGKLDLAAATQDLERIREDVAINVMTLYLEVLYSKELVEVAVSQVALSAQQVERSRELTSSGKEPESTLFESEALLAKDNLSLTQARNDLQLALLKLSQALNRESAAGFDIEIPTVEQVTQKALQGLGNAEAIYNYAAENRPHIHAERLRLQSSENSIAIARAGLYPSLSLRGGYGTGVYSSLDAGFWPQFRQNSNQFVGVSLNIPIFNRMASRNKVRSAKLSARTQQLAVTEAELALRKEIEQAWYNADAAYAKYLSSDAAFTSAQTAFVYMQEKANAGRATIFDFSDAKTKMEKAESDRIQARYEFVFRTKILDYYKGLPLEL